MGLAGVEFITGNVEDARTHLREPVRMMAEAESR